MVLTDQSCANFGSRLILFFFWGLAMPSIAVTDLEGLVQRADRWLQVPRPSALPRDLRLVNPSARAAFTLATFQGDLPTEACVKCGTWTASWCEGCYRREALEGAPLDYAPVCTTCDQSHLVCDQCLALGISWVEGNTAANQQHGHPSEDTLQVTGFFMEDGTFVEASTDIPCSRDRAGPSETDPGTGPAGASDDPSGGDGCLP
eukprot:s548_g20.t1